MKELNLGILRKLGACGDAIEIYEKRQEKDPIKAIELLIDGCEELVGVSNRVRMGWASWFMTRLLSDKDKTRYAIFAAEQVLGIFEKAYPDDKRPLEAIEAAKKYLNGNISAADAAYAAYAAHAAGNAAYAAEDYDDMLTLILRHGIKLLSGESDR